MRIGIDVNIVCNGNECTGCMACVDCCPRNCITIIDSLKKYEALINSDICIKCNKCRAICPVNDIPSFKHPVLWKQGWAVDAQIRLMSSSGGIASEIERSFIRNGGIVYSCTFDNGEFIFKSANIEKDVDNFVGSKYVKSNPRGVYNGVKESLLEGNKVLFVGLPCQVDAMKKYTKNNNKLYTIDLICHGTPSPMILNKFLEQKKIEIKNLQSIKFRHKNNYCLYDEKHKPLSGETIDHYTMTFLKSVIYTDNCYSCPYARIDRVSDITLGDSWGTFLSKIEQKKGISLILCQSEKGKQLLNNSNIELKDVNLKVAINNNHQLSHPSHPHKKRISFLDALSKGHTFNVAMFKSFPMYYTKCMIKNFISQFKTIYWMKK